MVDAFQVRSLRDGAVTAVDARFRPHLRPPQPRGVRGGAPVARRPALLERAWRGGGGAGQVITVNPAEAHDGAPVGEERAWSMLYVMPALVGDVVADLSKGRLATRELHAPVVDDARVGRLFRGGQDGGAAGRGRETFGERLLVPLAALLAPPRAPAPDAPGRLARVRERLYDHPAAPHPLAELAGLAGLSRSSSRAPSPKRPG